MLARRMPASRAPDHVLVTRPWQVTGASRTQGLLLARFRDASVYRSHLGSGASQLPALRCNGPVFLRPNHEDAYPGIRGRNVAIERRVSIEFRVEFQTQEFQCTARCRSHFGG